MSQIACDLPENWIPSQYMNRANESLRIMSVINRPAKEIAATVALAELVQMLFFVVLTVIYALAFCDVISPQLAGGIALVLLPIEALSSYNTFIHFKPFSRHLLTAAAIFTLTLCAGFALFGFVSDSAIALCAGGIALHLFRNLSECIDAKIAMKNPDYCREVLNESSLEKKQ